MGRNDKKINVHRHCGKCKQLIVHPLHEKDENVICPRCQWRLVDPKRCPHCNGELKE